MNFDSIPGELRIRRQWACTPLPRKLPVKPDGTAASSTDPTTWNAFESCVAVANKRKWGVAFIFTKDDPYTVVDLDHVRDAKTGETEAWAKAIIDELSSYSELSQSGTGWHIVVRGKLTAPGNKNGRVEIYDAAKPMTLTGDGSGSIRDVNIPAIHQRLLAADPKAEKKPEAVITSGDKSKDDFALACRLARQHGCEESKVLADFLQQSRQDNKKLNRADYALRTVKAAIAQVLTSRPLTEKTSSLPVVDEPEVKQEEEPLPPFPRLPGALGEIVDGITHDISYDHKALALITYIGLALAKRVSLVPDFWLQPRFYSCLVATASTGKSAAEFEVRRVCDEHELLRDVSVELSIDSGPALVEALAENPRLMLAPDELADQFEKARAGKTGRNSLFGEFLRLYESNETANHTKKKKGGEGGRVEIKNALFALIGGTTTQRFSQMFIGTGAVASGLQSRFVLAHSDQVMPRLKTPNDEAKIARACDELSTALFEEEHRKFRLSESAQDAIMDWRLFEDDGAEKMKRVVDMAKRFALVVAACSRLSEIDENTMRLGLQFADYQIALREMLFPPDAATYVQAFENRIIQFFEKHGTVSEAILQNKIRPEILHGGFESYNRAWAGLVRAGKVEAVGKSRKGRVLYELRND